MESESASHRRDLALAFAATAALLAASLANFLSYNGYPYSRPESGLVALGVLGIAAIVAILHACLPRLGRCLVEALLAAWFVDFNTDSIPLMIVAGLAVAAIGWWRRMSLLGPMALLGSVILVTTMLGLGSHPNWIKTESGSQSDAPRATAQPAIFHILLDEHLGLEGLSAEGPDGRQLADELRSAYQRAGFAIYGGAYSRYFDTVNAVPDVLNYGTRLGRAVRKGGVQVGPNAHFKLLTDRGYRLTVFQSDYADYCEGASFARCITYDSSSLRPTLDVPMLARERAQLIALKFLTLSDMFKAAAKGWNAVARILPLRRYDSDAKGSSTVGSLEAIGALGDQLAAAKPGDAYFAHLLLPHYPYAVGRDCSYLPWPGWLGRHSDAPLEARRRAYYDQVRCTTRKVAALVRSFTEAAGPNSIVIIHGDHGSRITSLDPYESNLGKLGAADLEAGFSTLFAIRAPGVQPAYSPLRAPIPLLLRDFTASDFRTAPDPVVTDPRVRIVARRSKRPVATLPLPTADVGPETISR